jgi:GH25 family lysozyme M1 (1,4-beta-N-acetylmuramidase)
MYYHFIGRVKNATDVQRGVVKEVINARVKIKPRFPVERAWTR